MILVQIGSGSSNLDTFFEDGFTNFIKKKKIKGKIFIIEANSIHLKNLKKCWNKNNVEIFNLAIIPDNIKKNIMTFYYSEKDKPNYQLFSSSIKFVKKHYPRGEIKSKIVKCMNISNFFKKNKLNNIDFLSLDIEGMDFDVIYNLDLKKYNIRNISFEHLNLSGWQKLKIVIKLIKNNYFFSGMGFDIRKSDWMFSKNFKKNIIMTILLPITPRRIWKHYLFSENIS